MDSRLPAGRQGFRGNDKNRKFLKMNGFPVFIAVGSNLGDRYLNCEKAVEAIGNLEGTRLIEKSKWYEFEALVEKGSPPQPSYINGVVKIETELDPFELFSSLQEVETQLGRIRTSKRWEPRTIDLDILFYGAGIIDTPALKIPHPELHKRPFVLKPMCDIAPDWVHPVLGKMVRDFGCAGDDF